MPTHLPESLSLAPRRIAAAFCLCLVNASAAPPAPREVPTARPLAVIETETVPNQGDAADDPAIWVHPYDAAASLVLGTDKKGGLNVFDLEGKRLQVVSDGTRPNNVDVLYGFSLGGRKVDLAIAGTRGKPGMGVAVWLIDPEKRRLSELGPAPAFTVFGGGEPYGSCVYRSPRDGSAYVFVTNKEGAIEQYRLDDGLRATLVRKLRVGSTAEGCVADSELGNLYVSEESAGIWKFGAEPDSGTAGTLVARVGENGLQADVEGLTLYCGAGGKGYLIASSQGAGAFKVYERGGTNAFVTTFLPADDPRLGVHETDGIDVVNVPTSSRFPRGLFVCQDGSKREGHQNFKFFAWDQIAGGALLIDTTRPVRPR